MAKYWIEHDSVDIEFNGFYGTFDVDTHFYSVQTVSVLVFIPCRCVVKIRLSTDRRTPENTFAYLRIKKRSFQCQKWFVVVLLCSWCHFLLRQNCCLLNHTQNAIDERREMYEYNGIMTGVHDRNLWSNMCVCAFECVDVCARVGVRECWYNVQMSIEMSSRFHTQANFCIQTHRHWIDYCIL